MASAMKKVTEAAQELTKEERNLLSVAYNFTRQLAWRVVSSIEIKPSPDLSILFRQPISEDMAKEYREKVEKELQEICPDVLGLLDKQLIAKASNAESKVLYLTMKGDYYRHLADSSLLSKVFSDSPTSAFATAKAEVVGESEKAYYAALVIAREQMQPTHPIRLGLALSVSIFFDEIMHLRVKARALARQALCYAIAGLCDNNNEDSYEDTKLIVQLLQDNITLWSVGG